MKFKTNYSLFQKEISQRDIRYLAHFTRFESVTAIVGEGRILPRDQLHNVAFEWRELINPNAQQRRDDPKYLNTSIMHPNVYLLKIFRDKWYPGSRFCVIGIDPKYIYEERTCFAITNATYEPAKRFGLNGSLDTFCAMFSSRIEGRPNRATGGRYTTIRKGSLASYYPTDTEAEVLIECEIPYDDILFIACQSPFEHNLLASAFDILRLPTEKFCVNPTLFEPRE